MAVSIQLSTVDKVFEATVSKATQESAEYYLEYRTKSYIKSFNF